MNSSIHGHQVLQLLLEQTAPIKRDKLMAMMQDRFGKDARYHTCSTEGMDAEALLNFLATKGKFIESAQGLNTLESKICRH
ncbi:YecH family metal-binding protein [Shewanella algae]